MSARTLKQIIPGRETSDGAGVKLRRSIGATASLRLDPFLLLDEFGTENPDDYIAGFPPHPHRGFETVTYMLEGHMRHEDHLGNIGDLKSGGVQWMTAGRGIIHSEMPQQESGRMRGFQLWLNLPARLKMRPAEYRDIPASAIPVAALPGAGQLKLIAGRCELKSQVLTAPVNADGSLATDPLFIDLQLLPGARHLQPVRSDYSAFVYVYEGRVSIGADAEARELGAAACGVLADGDVVEIRAGAQGASLILLAARPLHEPVVQSGPFVMNTRAQIEQALDDYRAGRLTD